MLDFDAPGTYDAFLARFPMFAQTYTVATGGEGWHVYLRVDVLPPSRRGQSVELCAEGRQIVAPPSVHPGSGQPYRVHLPLDIRRVPDLSEILTWMESAARPVRVRQADVEHRYASNKSASPILVTTIAETLRTRGYRQKGNWLNGPCIYPHRHAHDDSKTSFGFNIRTGYGNCFVCGSMLARDIARAIGLDPAA